MMITNRMIDDLQRFLLDHTRTQALHELVDVAEGLLGRGCLQVVALECNEKFIQT